MKLEEIDAAIAALETARREVVAAQQELCSHDWQPCPIVKGAKFCDKCGADDYSAACSKIAWRDEWQSWSYDVPPSEFCWKHKRPSVECPA